MNIIGLRCPKGFGFISEYFMKREIEAVVMEPSRVMGELHIVSAWEHAERSFANGTNRSKSMITEFLLYMAGERQISKAISVMRPEGSEFVIFFPGGLDEQELSKLSSCRDDTMIAASEHKAAAMGLDPNGMDIPYEDLALELVAMVDILKG